MISESTSKKVKAKRMSVVWVLVVTGVITFGILSRVDDWGRDFSTNVAMTGENSKLKPLRLALSSDEALTLLRNTVAGMSHWNWQSDRRDDDGTVTVQLVRSTTLFRFKDDVQVVLSPDESNTGVVINAVSRSRVGKGDLGQNPRNIKELFDRLAQ